MLYHWQEVIVKNSKTKNSDAASTSYNESIHLHKNHQLQTLSYILEVFDSPSWVQKSEKGVTLAP